MCASQLTLTWSDNGNNEIGFKIERSPDGATFTEIATVARDTTTYLDAGLASGTRYWYRVRAYNGHGDSDYTPIGSAVTGGGVPNKPPTISNLTDRTIASDTSTGPINITVGDAETPAGSLTLSAASSNPSLLPVASIVFGGSGADRTLNATPAAGQSGAATITVTVSDGRASASDSFVLTVNNTPANTPPTIAGLSDRAINEDTNTGAVPFTVSDAETAAGSLMVTASSSNPALLPQSALVLAGSGSSRTLTATPTANQSGSATITLTVSDGALMATSSLVLTVNAVNDAPTLTNIADHTTSAGTAAGPLGFTIGDVETVADSLMVTAVSSNQALVPNAQLAFTGSGANRTLTVTPAAGQTGSSTITVTVSDGALSAADTFVLTVTPPSWQSVDVGAVGAAGSSSESSGITVVRGSGEDIGNGGDEFHYRYLTFVGDGEVVSRVRGVEATDLWAKAGLMLRASLDPAAPHAFIYATPGATVRFQRRASAGGSTQTGNVNFALPGVWVKLVRAGTLFVGYWSMDGTNWRLAGSTNLALPAAILVGFAVTSRRDGILCTASFDQTEIEAVPPAPP